MALTSHPKHPPTLWLTGLSGSGKTTAGQALVKHLKTLKLACHHLDGDELRQGLCRDLGFSAVDRRENIRRCAEVARMMNEAGLLVVCGLISPLRADRAMAADIIGAAHFVEVHVSTPLAICEARDPKGLYQRARDGRITGFTGVSAPYEAPESPAMVLDTSQFDIAQTVSRLMRLLSTAEVPAEERRPTPRN